MPAHRALACRSHQQTHFQVYPSHQLALAVIHFSSGQAFNRAIRYWCTCPTLATQDRARALNPAGERGSGLLGLCRVPTVPIPCTWMAPEVGECGTL